MTVLRAQTLYARARPRRTRCGSASCMSMKTTSGGAWASACAVNHAITSSIVAHECTRRSRAFIIAAAETVQDTIVCHQVRNSARRTSTKHPHFPNASPQNYGETRPHRDGNCGAAHAPLATARTNASSSTRSTRAPATTIRGGDDTGTGGGGAAATSTGPPPITASSATISTSPADGPCGDPGVPPAEAVLEVLVTVVGTVTAGNPPRGAATPPMVLNVSSSSLWTAARGNGTSSANMVPMSGRDITGRNQPCIACKRKREVMRSCSSARGGGGGGCPHRNNDLRE